MANLILGNSLVSNALSTINDFSSSDIFTSEANKLWRAKILLDRVTRPLKTGGSYTPDSLAKVHKQNVDPGPLGVQHISPTGHVSAEIFQGFNVGINRAFKEAYYSSVEAEFRYETDDGTEPLGDSKIVDNRLNNRNSEGSYDSISDQDTFRTDQIILYNFMVSPVQYIVLQTIPKEIEFQGESTWAVIHSMGRNVPMYHFTGAESTIQMNISWYCNDPAHPEEVVAKCRLLEAWTKANSYLASPPVLKIQWGSSELFKDQYFILTAATYKLSNWRANAKERIKGTSKFRTRNGYADPAMYPSTATQELILRRVSANNLSYQDIIPQVWVDSVGGINKNTTNPNQ